jgi:uncharacterized protein involved in cysteine biosynthesis
MSSSSSADASRNGGHPSLVDQLKERAIEFGQHSTEAISSFAWMWPIRGIIYTATHPQILMSVRSALLRSLLLSIVVFAVVAVVFYVPQAAILSVITGFFGPFIAIILVAAESVLILTAFARQLFLGPALAEVFDATLRAQGQQELVLRGKKALAQTSGRGEAVGKALIRPLQGFTFDGVVRYLITLPMNFVPVVGTIFFLLYNGHEGGAGWHSRYFQLKRMDKQQKSAFVTERQPAYTAFGAATLLLNFVPFVGLVFSFTNTVGAALWAAQLEARSNIIDTPTAGGSRSARAAAGSGKKKEL